MYDIIITITCPRTTNNACVLKTKKNFWSWKRGRFCFVFFFVCAPPIPFQVVVTAKRVLARIVSQYYLYTPRLDIITYRTWYLYKEVYAGHSKMIHPISVGYKSFEPVVGVEWTIHIIWGRDSQGFSTAGRLRSETPDPNYEGFRSVVVVMPTDQL